MKEKLTLRNVLIAYGALLGILVFVFSFLVSAKEASGDQGMKFLGVIWGSSSAKVIGSEDTMDVNTKALILPLIGAILALLGGLAGCFFGFFGDKIFKEEKVKKIAIICSGSLLLLGGVFLFFTKNAWFAYQADEAGLTVSQIKALYDTTGVKVSTTLAVISAILGVIGGGAIIASQFVQDKQLAK